MKLLNLADENYPIIFQPNMLNSVCYFYHNDRSNCLSLRNLLVAHPDLLILMYTVRQRFVNNFIFSPLKSVHKRGLLKKCQIELITSHWSVINIPLEKWLLKRKLNCFKPFKVIPNFGHFFIWFK